MSKRQFILRLDPDDPIEARLIARLERARQAAWGGVQQEIKRALLQSEGNLPSPRRETETPATPEKTEPPASLVNALEQAISGINSHAARAMAASEPLRSVRALYVALEAFSPDSLTETEALLLNVAAQRIRSLLDTAAAARQPIRQILTQEKSQ